ncbi:hypothetical protein C8R47DRAFT_1084652 [Mycena vitilis]|nr:hypothetical protein C8R47DRAFT_1084652 [Mycena vitilis]
MSTTTVCLVLQPVLVIQLLGWKLHRNSSGRFINYSPSRTCSGRYRTSRSPPDVQVTADGTGYGSTFQLPPDDRVVRSPVQPADVQVFTGRGMGYGSTFRPPDGQILDRVVLGPWAVPFSKPGVSQAAMGWPALIGDVPHCWRGTGGTSLPPTGPSHQNAGTAHILRGLFVGCPSTTVGQPTYFYGQRWDVP